MYTCLLFVNQGGRWVIALDLLSRMQQEGCKPNTVTYNSLIAACAHHSGLWDKAEQLFDQMQIEVTHWSFSCLTLYV